MIVASELLALSLYKFDELSQVRKKDVEYYKKNRTCYIPSKGDVHLYRTLDEDYLAVNKDLWLNSKIKEIYGNRVYRINDDSFDTLLCSILTKLALKNDYSTFSTDRLLKLITSFNLILEKWDYNVWKFYHWLLFVDDFLDIKFNDSLLKTIKFFNVVEILIFNKSKNNTENCKDILPQFLLGAKPEQLYIWPSFLLENYQPARDKSKEICENIAIIRNKVTHNDFQKVFKALEGLFSQNSLTEDAESNGNFDQVRVYNMILDTIIVNIFEMLINSPQEVLNLSN